jgi:uncharacterized protein (TIGR03086 family)
MDGAADPIGVLSRALDQTGDIISRVRPDQASLPTPCRSWDVRTLVNHTVLDVQRFVVSVNEGSWEQRDEDVIGDDWIGAYREAADPLLKAWSREGMLDRTLHLTIGDVPAAWSLGLQVSDLVVHGWDIAQAIGAPIEDLDPELARSALDWGMENLKPQFRGDEASGNTFGPEVLIASDAPLYDRLAAWFGRSPG